MISAPGTTNGTFSQANELMSYAVTLPATSVDPIFNKYFSPGDKNTVLNMFHRLLGDDDVSGAPAMSNIKVVGDNNTPPGMPAYLDDFDDPGPTLGLNDDAFVYENRDDKPNACKTWADEGMTTDMYMIASVLLHEYVHWDWFLGSIHHGEVIDQTNGYG